MCEKSVVEREGHALLNMRLHVLKSAESYYQATFLEGLVFLCDS